LKFRLDGRRLNGDFALVHIKSRRGGSKGNEWLLIKKKDEFAEPGFNPEQFDTSILTNRTLDEIGGDQRSKEWQSDRPASTRTKPKAAWLADTLARVEKKKRKAITTGSADNAEAGRAKKTTRGSTAAKKKLRSSRAT
jgi:bifunctional non-homologous end joining protein LigD